MHKITAYSSALALAIAATVTVSTPAAAQAANDDVGFCRTLVSFNAYDTVGECMAATRTAPVNACKLLDSLNALDFFGYRNRGDCVSGLRQLF